MRRTQKPPSWLPVAAVAAIALAGGCTAAPAGPQAVPVTSSHNGKFQIKSEHGKQFCTSCNTELNAQGRHKMSNLLVKSLKFLRTGEVLKAAPPKPGDLTLKDTVVIGLHTLGLDAKIGTPEGQDPYAQVNLMPDYVPDLAAAQAYVASNPSGCCIPDGQPAPDPPY